VAEKARWREKSDAGVCNSESTGGTARSMECTPVICIVCENQEAWTTRGYEARQTPLCMAGSAA
jgi:hypothetical protein